MNHIEKLSLRVKLYSYSDYYPQNIMQDRRIARGNTYAAMVIPAGTNPDAMLTEKKFDKKKTMKRST